MTWFVILVCIIAMFVMLFRHLRKREMDAFREADMSVFEDFKAKREKKRKDPLTAKAQAYLALNPAPGSPKVVPPETETPLPAAPAPVYELKEDLFDEVHRLFYQNLERVAGDNFRIFVNVPLQEFIRSGEEKSGVLLLQGKSVSFLLCSKSAMTVAAGIQLRGAGADLNRQFDLLQELFSQIGKPLLDFPLINNISEAEIREKLQDVLAQSAPTRSCPKCGREMVMRKAIKGKNAGKKFWVCTEFPDCKGIIRAWGQYT